MWQISYTALQSTDVLANISDCSSLAGNSLCSQSWCSDGMFYSKHCSSCNVSGCGVIIKTSADYDAGVIEALINTFGLNLTAVYPTNFDELVDRLAATSTPFVGYFWQPSTMLQVIIIDYHHHHHHHYNHYYHYRYHHHHHYYCGLLLATQYHAAACRSLIAAD